MPETILCLEMSVVKSPCQVSDKCIERALSMSYLKLS